MFSANMKQFGIRHVFAGFILVSVGMALVFSGWYPAITLGILLLVAASGGFFASVLMLVSDMIDDRRIDDRKRLSRFFNFCALMVVATTTICVLGLGVLFLLEFGFAMLDEVLLPDNSS